MGKYVVKLSVIGPTGRARITQYVRGGAPLYANRLKDAEVFTSKAKATRTRDAVRGLMKYLPNRGAVVSVQEWTEAEAELHRRAADAGA